MQLLEGRIIGDEAIQGVTKCPFCGDEKTFLLDLDAFMAWRRGQCVQIAFPNLSEDDRERLISGIDPTCWDKLVGAV